MVAVGSFGRPTAAAGQEGPVRAVLFFSPTCPHCHEVIRDDLPRFFARFGGEPRFERGEGGHLVANDRLEILLVDASHPDGFAAYEAHGRAVALSPDRRGVPRLVCGDSVLVGSLEIPERFPALIERGLASGGVDWPAIDGLARLIPVDSTAAPAVARAAPDTTTVVVADTVSATNADSVPTRAELRHGTLSEPRPPVTDAGAPVVDTAPPPASVVPGEIIEGRGGSVLARTLATDPVGTVLALLVLIGMIGAMAWSFTRAGHAEARAGAWWVPILTAVGLGVAGYLTFVEASGTPAVCGPVGDCNTVQQSRYAGVFGIPVALLGLAGYVAVFGAWWAGRTLVGVRRVWAARTAFWLAFAGTVASAVLTFLEPFVIGAVCAWCLTSAVVMTALMGVLAGPRRSRVPRGIPARVREEFADSARDVSESTRRLVQ
jgi:uncharacterized membrane protein